MKISVLRFKDTGNETLGLLMINGKHRGYTIEDEEREVKVMHETRIPEGTYKVGLREYGGHHERYSKKFPNLHVGMLQVFDVPGFTDILIHIGNTDGDTSGCLLVGEAIGSDQKSIVSSTKKYTEIYFEIARAIKQGEPVTIEYKKIYD